MVDVEIDEAATIPEATILILLGKCLSTFGKKITSIIQCGDVNHLGPMVNGADGSRDMKAVNLFLAQQHWSLFSRPHKAGFPRASSTPKPVCITRSSRCPTKSSIVARYRAQVAEILTCVQDSETSSSRSSHSPPDSRMRDDDSRIMYHEITHAEVRYVDGSKCNLAHFKSHFKSSMATKSTRKSAFSSPSMRRSGCMLRHFKLRERKATSTKGFPHCLPLIRQSDKVRASSSLT